GSRPRAGEKAPSSPPGKERGRAGRAGRSGGGRREAFRAGSYPSVACRLRTAPEWDLRVLPWPDFVIVCPVPRRRAPGTGGDARPTQLAAMNPGELAENL